MDSDSENFALERLDEKPNAQVQRRRSEAQGTNTEGVGVRCNAQLGWWQWAGCTGSETAHEATAWCARCAVMPAS